METETEKEVEPKADAKAILEADEAEEDNKKNDTEIKKMSLVCTFMILTIKKFI